MQTTPVEACQSAGEWRNPVKLGYSELVTNNTFSSRLGTSRKCTDSDHRFPPRKGVSHPIVYDDRGNAVRRLMVTRMVKITIEVEVARVPPAVGAFSLMTPRFIAVTVWLQ